MKKVSVSERKVSAPIPIPKLDLGFRHTLFFRTYLVTNLNILFTSFLSFYNGVLWTWMLASSLHNHGDSLNCHFIGNVVTTMHIANKMASETVATIVKGACQHSGSQGTIVKERCRLISCFTAASLHQVNKKCVEVSRL